ncbi:MAG: tetratricopeptide repeat protein [Flavobacteriales bacterium]|nr:tetratricopeptide repeat protein [Flavobacteriales bacterium]
MKFFWIVLLLLLTSEPAFNQNFADKSYYLVDSLVLSELQSSDKQFIDSCLKVYHEAKEDTIRINCINEIVNKSWDMNVWPKYNQWIHDYTGKLIREKKPKGRSYKMIAGFYAGSLNNLGLLYTEQGKVKKALDQYFKALAILTEIGEKDVQATCLNNIGIIYNSQNDLQNALKYFKESLSLREELGNHQQTSAALNNIGFIYGKLEDYPQSKIYHLRSLSIRQENGDQRGIAESLNNLGTLIKREAEALEAGKGNSDSIQKKVYASLAYFEQSIGIQEEIKDVKGLSNTLNNVAHIYYDLGQFKESRKHGERALQLALSDQNARNTLKASELLYRLYEQLNEPKKALESYKLFISTRDSINNIETQKATIEKNMEYEFAKKDALTQAAHEKEMALQGAEKRKQVVIIWFGSIGLLIVIIFTIITINKLKVTRKQKLLIEEKNKENELLLGEIHHRVKNNLQVISSLLSLQERNIKDASTKAAISEGKERVKSMGLIHKLLYQHENYAGVDMDDYTSQLIEGLLNSFGYDPEKFNLKVNLSHLKLDVDSAVPLGLIINELVVNALKYAYTSIPNPELTVSLSHESDHLTLIVADNGTGAEKQPSSADSFGLKLVHSLIRQLGGELRILDQTGTGYEIKVTHFKIIT